MEVIDQGNAWFLSLTTKYFIKVKMNVSSIYRMWISSYLVSVYTLSIQNSRISLLELDWVTQEIRHDCFQRVNDDWICKLCEATLVEDAKHVGGSQADSNFPLVPSLLRTGFLQCHRRCFQIRFRHFNVFSQPSTIWRLHPSPLLQIVLEITVFFKISCSFPGSMYKGHFVPSVLKSSQAFLKAPASSHVDCWMTRGTMLSSELSSSHVCNFMTQFN